MGTVWGKTSGVWKKIMKVFEVGCRVLNSFTFNKHQEAFWVHEKIWYGKKICWHWVSQLVEGEKYEMVEIN